MDKHLLSNLLLLCIYVTIDFSDQLINISPAQTDDDKREELVKLLSTQYNAEKELQLEEIPNVRSFMG